MRTKLMLTCHFFVSTVLLLTAATAWASPKYSLDISYLGLYESNIYHAYLDTQQVGAQLNEFSARGSALLTQSDRLSHRFDAYTNLDLYINYGNRNRSSFGLTYVPMLKYAKRASVHLDIDISRRNRDLVSDAGEYLNRNLGQTVLGIKATNRLSLGIFRAEQSFEYSDHDYDDSYDTNGVRLASYDYHFWQGVVSIKARITRDVSLVGEIGCEKRYYDERKTYPVLKGPVKGYGVVREYDEWVEGLALQTELTRSIGFDFIIEYTDRTDNFEDFYGYHQWKYGMRAKVDVSRRDQLKITFDLRTKDYPNYWTKNTGRNGRVSIDYATFEMENYYALASGIDLTVYVKNFNKVSNERYVPGIAVPSYDYQDFSVGLGLAVEL